MGYLSISKGVNLGDCKPQRPENPLLKANEGWPTRQEVPRGPLFHGVVATHFPLTISLRFPSLSSHSSLYRPSCNRACLPLAARPHRCSGIVVHGLIRSVGSGIGRPQSGKVGFRGKTARQEPRGFVMPSYAPRNNAPVALTVYRGSPWQAYRPINSSSEGRPRPWPRRSTG